MPFVIAQVEPPVPCVAGRTYRLFWMRGFGRTMRRAWWMAPAATSSGVASNGAMSAPLASALVQTSPRRFVGYAMVGSQMAMEPAEESWPPETLAWYTSKRRLVALSKTR
jgi:hypothetical protein